MSYVRIQIAGVSSLDEARRLLALGVDGLGFTVRLPTGLHNGLTEEKARAIISALPPLIGTIAITYVTDPEEAILLSQFLGVNALQLHAPLAAGTLSTIRARLPNVKLIRSVNVISRASVAEVIHAADEADAIILDTFDPATGKHGATGRTHDWRISREIVVKSHRPVILAGGLTPTNVGDAIRAVQPWGVDAHTGLEGPDGTRDWGKTAAFIAAVREQGNV